MTNKAEYMREWNRLHPGKMMEYQAVYRARHREEINKRNQMWALEHPDRIAVHDHKYYEKHKPKLIAYAKAWQKRNRALSAFEIETVSSSFRRGQRHPSISEKGA
jgi:hypothetical protein